jgi:hypothetical protein
MGAGALAGTSAFEELLPSFAEAKRGGVTRGDLAILLAAQIAEALASLVLLRRLRMPVTFSIGPPSAAATPGATTQASVRWSLSIPMIRAAVTRKFAVLKARTPTRYAAMNASSSVTSTFSVVCASLNIFPG